MLLKDLREYKIILASASPRRRTLLESVGISFEHRKGADTDERYPDDLIGEEIPLYLAEKKSCAMKEELKDREILITADTIVYQDGEVLLKPGNREEALETIRMLSGNSHFVYTGVYLRSAKSSSGFVASTEVRFGELSEEEISYYVDEFEPYDKAGAYGIQEWIGYVGVEEIKGSYFNVMGLPVHQLYRELEEFIHKNAN